jgi:hypothetical protein
VRKRYSSNYSLWPEQTRPRRAIPLTLAAGGFAIGIVCAVAVHNVVTDFLHRVSTQEVAQESTVAHVPLYATATAPAPAADPVKPASRARSRRSVAKITLPTIGARAITPSPNTDGRGGGTDRGGDVLTGETPVAALTAPPASQPMTPIEDSKPADKPSTEASTRKAKPAARERPAKVHTHRTAQKKRERPTIYASRYSNMPFSGYRNVPFSGYRNGPYFGYRGHATYGYGGYGGGYGRVYAWPQW